MYVTNFGPQLGVAHLVPQFQGLQPPLALLQGAECGTVGDNVGLPLDAAHLAQQFQGLLPPVAL